MPLGAAHKTGLGSSAALITALTAALLSHYLARDVFDVSTQRGRATLHNLAQAAHCAAQAKVGSGFDVAAAVYGSRVYRRFSPDLLAQLPEPGAPGFAARLAAAVDAAAWDVEVRADGLSLPAGLVLRMCDIDGGSQTVGMAKKVLAWRARDADRAKQLWDELQRRSDRLAVALGDGAVDDLPPAFAAVRQLSRDMGALSDVPIEPPAQTELLDALGAVDGVYGGVVPGAGGYDALALVMRDDDDTARRINACLAAWSANKGAQARLLGVKGEMEGVRREDLDLYAEWL